MIKSAIVVALLAACGGHAPSPAAPAPAGPASPAEAAPAAAVTPSTPLTIAELGFYDGDDKGMMLHADGRFEIKAKHTEAGKPTEETWISVGRLGADGSLARPDGTVVGKLAADGRFVAADGRVAPFSLDGETLVIGAKHVTLDAQGQLVGGEPGSHVHVTGLSDVGSRRAALLLLAIALADAHAGAVPAPATATP